MCRLFGFRSVLSSHVHASLVSADNALVTQSERHPDGWGVAYYREGAPHLLKSTRTALECSLFQRVSGVVTSETVVAHLRKATQGPLSVLNTHPFQYGPWVFAHNGNIKAFAKVRPRLLAAIAPELRAFILGETDSELIFYLILTHLRTHGDLRAHDYPVAAVCGAISAALAQIVGLVGEFSRADGDPRKTYLTFVLTNGVVMVAHQGGKGLYYSTYKGRCPERDTCWAYAPECEAATTGHVNHLIFSSEPLQGENVWLPMAAGEMVGVDGSMTLHRVG